jgi:hypothetical protein
LNRKIQIRRSKQGRGGAHRGKLAGEVLRYWILHVGVLPVVFSGDGVLDDLQKITANSKA